MGWYEAIKDGINVAQKVDNIPLVNELIDAQKQILDLIHDNEELKKINAKLQEINEISDKIERHKDAYVTLKGDDNNIIYCSSCWDNEHKLIQAQIDERWGEYYCPACKYKGYYDKDKHSKMIEFEESENVATPW